MSIVKGPLFSLDADGTIGKSLSYSKKSQNNIVSKYSKPGDVSPGESSPRQKDQRSIIKLITIHWQCMDDIDRLTWETAAKAARFKGSGYHYFLHMAQTDLLTYLGLIGYWSMNYETGGFIPDLSGNGNHGTLMPVYPCDCPTFIDSFNKKQGKALSLNGSGTYVNSGSSSILDTVFFENNPFTFIQLVKISGTGSYYPQVNKGSYSNGFTIHGNKGRFEGGDGLGNHFDRDNFYGPTILNLGWFHTVATYDGSLLKGYLNGQFIQSLAWAFGLGTNISSDLKLGIFWAGGGPMTIDDTLIFNKCLTSKEILALYKSYNLS